MKKVFIIFLVLVIFLSCVSCGLSNESVSVTAPMHSEKDEVKEKRVSFFGVGDNLIHNCVYWQAEDNAGGDGHDFKPMYSLVSENIKNADIAYINQETILGGVELGLSSYPLFNSPIQLGEDMRELGFDIFSHATNHVFDKGEKGIANTYDFYSKNPDITMTGIYKKGDKLFKITEKNGIKFAFVNYTFHTNGMSLSSESEYVVPVVKNNNTDELINTVNEAKNEADFVVCFIHWGDENQTQYNKIQEDTARKLEAAGCDAIIGTHPHSIQPVEFINDMLVAYSLGNFISAQNKPVNLIGGTISFDFVINGDEKKIENVSFLPVINQYENSFANIRIVPFNQYTPDMVQSHGVNVTYDYFKNIIESTINEQYIKY